MAAGARARFCATVAISTMVCNNLVMPVLLRRWKGRPPMADLSTLLGGRPPVNPRPAPTMEVADGDEGAG